MKGETHPKRGVNSHLEQDICIHIFTVSSAMVGVCLTVIGLIRVVITLGTADTLADDLLAADALLFLISSLLSTGRFARGVCAECIALKELRMGSLSSP